MSKKLFSIVFAVCLLMGINIASANTVNNIRRGANQPRPSAALPLQNNVPAWAPKLISAPTFESLSQGVTMLNQKKLAPQQNDLISPSGASIQGLRAQSTDPDFQRGWYELSSDGRENLLWTSEALAETVGFVKGSELYTFFSLEFMGQIIVSCNVYDLNTGELIDSTELNNSDHSQMVLSAVYDELEDVAYVYTYNADMTGALIQSVDLDTFEFTPIRSDENILLDRVVAWAYSPVDHNIYGVNLSGYFVRMDKDSGLFVSIGLTGVTPGTFAQSMVYSPLDQKFVWACILPDQTSCLFAIDPTTGLARSTCRYDYANQYTILYTPDKICADNAPGLATFKSLQFEGASTTGKGVVTLPTVNYIGENITGEVYLKICDGRNVIHSELKGQVGEDVEFELTLTEGLHDVSATPFIKADGENVEGHPIFKQVYVGYDTPQKPTNVTFTETSATWDAVGSVGVNGGFVDATAVTYNVYVNGVKQNEQPITGTAFDLTIPDAELAYYTLEVEATSNGKTSEKASATELFGHPFSVPYSATPSETEFNLFTVVNRSNGFWRYKTGADEPFYHMSGTDTASDDWVFLPLISFEDTEHLYEVSFDARCHLAEYGNILQVGISKTTNPDDAEIFYTQSFNNTDYLNFKKMFNVSEAGDYHIAIKCASMTDGFYLYLKNIKVRATENKLDAPEACENLKLTPAAQGALKTKVEFIMPRKTIAGNSLYTVGGGDLTATIKSDAETLTVSGKPGSRHSLDITTIHGMNAIYVYVSNSYGDGEEVRGMVFCGEDAPTFTNIKIDASSDNLTALISWDEPKAGKNGGYLDPANLVYTIYNSHQATGEWIELGSVTGKTEFNFPLPAGAKLQLLKLGLTVSNQYGGGEELTYATIVLGPPHQLPMTETFNGSIAYEPIASQPMGTDYLGQWTFANPIEVNVNAANQTGFALVGFTETNENTYGRIALPKFSTIGTENAELKMRFFIADFTPDTEVLLCENADNEIVLGTVSSQDGEGWVTKTFVFPDEFQNKPWAYIALRANYNSSTQYLLMDSYTVKDPLAQDVAMVQIEGPNSTLIGNTEYYYVTIENNGYEKIAVPNVVCQLITEDGKTVNLEAKDTPDTAELAPTEQLKFKFEFKPAVNHIGNQKIRATIENNDMDMSNNSIEQAVVVKLGTDPIVTDLEATYEQGGHSVELNWTAPIVSLGLEDFEDMTAFSYEENLGEWTNIDGDGCVIWVFGTWQYPDCGLPKAFQVFDYSQLPITDSTFEAYSGDKYLVAISPDDQVSNADDWLISPEIQGGSTVAFQLGIINQLYAPEYIEVMYSSTTKDKGAFKVVEKFSKATMGWELITVKLPADAKYFAIHYISKDTFGIMIDDISYAPVGQTVDIVGYNIYRDGEKIAEKVTGTSYVDSSLEVKDYVYNVTVIVNKDGTEVEYPMSNNAYANLLTNLDEIALKGAIYANDGCIVLAGYSNQEYSVYTIDGICVASGTAKADTEKIAVTPNVYIIKASTQVEKIIVK